MSLNLYLNEITKFIRQQIKDSVDIVNGHNIIGYVFVSVIK